MSDKLSILESRPLNLGDRDAAQDAVHKLLEDARKALEEQQKPKQPREATPDPAPVSEEERLKYVYEASSRVLSNFSALDTTDNGFLGKHELESARGNSDATALLHLYPRITPLHFDGIQTRYKWISQDHLGISQGDLTELKAITSSNPSDRANYLSSKTWAHAGPGVLLGGVVATAGTLFATNGFRRPGLIGIGVGLGIGALSWSLSRWSATEEFEEKRSSFSKDTTLDYLIRRKQ